MVKVKYFGLDNGGCLNVGGLTPDTQAELVKDLPKIGDDLTAILMKGKYKSVKKVK